FLGILKNGDHQFVEDLAAALDQVKMPVGRRIERSGIDGFDALHSPSVRERRIVCGGKRGWQSEGDVIKVKGDGGEMMESRASPPGRRARRPSLHRLTSCALAGVTASPPAPSPLPPLSASS